MKKTIYTILFAIAFVATVNAQSLKILFVDDTPDNFGNAERLRAFVDSAGYKSTLFDAATLGTSPILDTLKKYRLVIWHTASQGAGLQFWGGADLDNTAIKQYLDGGGSLWVVGNDFMYDRYGAPSSTFTAGNFPYDYLGISSYDAQSYGNDGSLGVPKVAPDASAPIAALDTIDWTFATLWWADAVTLRTGAKAVYKMDGDATYPLKNKITGTFYNNGNFRTLSFFFDLALAKDAKLKSTMKKVLDYFQLISSSYEIDDVHIAAQSTPNPFKSSTIIEFEVNQSALVNVSIFDIHGKKIEQVLSNQYLPIGKQTIQWTSSSTLPVGVYLCKIQEDNRISTIKIVKQ